jgi:hypothetical protein
MGGSPESQAGNHHFRSGQWQNLRVPNASRPVVESGRCRLLARTGNLGHNGAANHAGCGTRGQIRLLAGLTIKSQRSSSIPMTNSDSRQESSTWLWTGLRKQLQARCSTRELSLPLVRCLSMRKRFVASSLSRRSGQRSSLRRKILQGLSCMDRLKRNLRTKRIQNPMPNGRRSRFCR